jgi:hypothetical protein
MQFSNPRKFGIHKRSHILGSRPAFMESMPPRVAPHCDANYVLLTEGGRGVSALRMRRMSRSSSSFPLKDDAGYIGYLTDDENVSRDEGGGRMMRLVNCRREDLLGSDMSFSSCLFLFITVCGLLMLFIFAVSPWGVPPPKRL